MVEIRINEHALKHGVSEEDILHAWANFTFLRYRPAPREGEFVAIGPDVNGRFVQIVGRDSEDDTLIIHALRPPTEKVVR